MSVEIAQMTAAQLVESYRQKSLSPVEVFRASQARLDSLNPKLNAFYELSPCAEREAFESEKRWMKGAPCGPLDGVPSSVKDALPSVGMTSYRGSAAHRADEQVWTTDAPSIARMREAGAIFLGKTTMPDFGILASGYSSKHGITRNPWRLDVTPGGSSAGSGSAIAAGIHPIAVGTDIVGSIRLPASFCGLVGHKPSYGRVPYYFPNSPALVAGPMARTVEDAALLLEVIARPDARDATALPYDGTKYSAFIQRKPDHGTRIAWISSLGLGLEPDPEVIALVEAQVLSLKKEGFAVDDMKPGFDKAALESSILFYKTRCRAELLAMPPERQRDAQVISDWSKDADDLSAVAFYRLFDEQQRLRDRVNRLIDVYDFIVLPTVHRPPFDAGSPGLADEGLFAPFANCFLFNLTEQPACSVPVGTTKDGLPVGLQIVGRRYDDAGVLQMAAHIERSFPTMQLQNDIIRGISA